MAMITRREFTTFGNFAETKHLDSPPASQRLWIVYPLGFSPPPWTRHAAQICITSPQCTFGSLTYSPGQKRCVSLLFFAKSYGRWLQNYFSRFTPFAFFFIILYSFENQRDCSSDSEYPTTVWWRWTRISVHPLEMTVLSCLNLDRRWIRDFYFSLLFLPFYRNFAES